MRVHQDRSDDRRHRHVVQFYRDEKDLADRVAAFVAVPLLAGERAVIVATGPHARAIQDQLAARGLEVTRLRSHGKLRVLDAAEIYGQVAPPGRIDGDAFRRVIAEPLNAAARPSTSPVRVYGEIVDLLARDGRLSDAIVLEQLWTS